MSILSDNGGGLGIKAAGGIKTLDAALALIEAGATRLGTSSGWRHLPRSARALGARRLIFLGLDGVGLELASSLA